MASRMLVGWLVAAAWAATGNAAPFLEGTVTDEQGRPVQGVTVKIWDCIGTCLGGKVVLTDKDGHYVFEEKPFRNYPSLAISMPGRYEVSRNESGPGLSEPDTETPRRVDSVLGSPAAAIVSLKGDPPDGWTQTVSIRPGKESPVRRYEMKPRFVEGYDYWYFELLPRNEDLHLVVTRVPVVEPSDDREEMRERERESWRQRVTIVSGPIRLVDPQLYRVNASLVSSETGGASISIDSITDVLGTDRTEELAQSDARFGGPVDSEAQEQALELMQQVRQAAVPWNARAVQGKIESFEYDVINQNDEVTHVRIDKNSPVGPAWSDISRQRGFAYMPPLRWLFSQPENIEFLSMEIGVERAELVYRLKSRRGSALGIGIGPSWNGFVQSSFSQGTIVIDPKKNTVLEHRYSMSPLEKESVETFGDYVAVGEGYAPEIMNINTGSLDVHLKFHVHDDSLWLLAEATRDGQEKPSLRIENVTVVSTE